MQGQFEQVRQYDEEDFVCMSSAMQAIQGFQCCLDPLLIVALPASV